jgi:hypothetical protein
MLSEKLIDRAVAEIQKGYAQYQYFFDHLNSPEWLEPLAARGIFKDPPKPVSNGEYVSLAWWPASKYLVRMSRIPDVQAKVVDIALLIPNTENGRVHDDIADIALSVPAALSAKLVPQIAAYTETPIKLLLAEKVGDLICHLADGRQTGAAVRLTSAALAVAPDTKSPKARHGDPRTRFRDWYYGRIIQKALPALVENAGVDAVKLFSGLLNDVATVSTEDDGLGEDYFYVRFPAIELGPGIHDDPASLLLSATRDASVGVVSRDSSKFEPVIEALRRFKWKSFRRLELHLSRIYQDQGLAVAEKMFEDPSILENSSLHHEAILLLREVFAKLSGETQQRILAWMDAGPPEDQIRRFLEFCKQPTDDENIIRVRDARRRNRFAILDGQLPENYQKIYQALVKSLGEADPPERPPIRTFGAVGSKSPKSAEELAEMPVEQVMEFLQSWEGSADFLAPTLDGLGNSFASMVSRRPAEFVAVAERFRDLDPTYVRALFGALTTSSKKGDKWDWTPVLELAAWVTGRPREIPGRKGGMLIADPDWGWTRDSIMELLKAGFEGGSERLPLEHRDLVWKILEPLTEDPSPTVNDEKGEHFDPSFLSINSPRGRAMETVLHYSQWVRNSLKKSAPNAPQPDLEAMPEVRRALDRHLDTSCEPTLTIRSVYGQHVAWLANLDLKWFRDNASRIFPEETEASAYFNSAWDSFVVFNHPHDSLLSELLPAYKKAVSEIERPRTTKHSGSPGQSLAQHLMAYYWRGHIEFDGEDRLLAEFYGRAPSELRAHALWFIGRSVAGWEAEVPATVMERLRNLMDRRVAAAEQSGQPDTFEKELSSFVWWFTSQKFDDRWSLETLLRVLRMTRKMGDDMDLVKRLAALCPQYPVECVECLGLLIEGDRERWILVGTEVDAQLLVKAALESQRPEAIRAAKGLVELLIGKGYYSFRRLLESTG